MTAQELQNLLSLVCPIHSITANQLMNYTKVNRLNKSELLEKDKQPILYEFIVLTGIIRKFITNKSGKEFTTGFYTAGKPISPALLRGLNFESFVNLEVISNQAEIACFSYHEMENNMQNSKDLQQFGYKVMMIDAFERAEREKILLASTGKEKLQWFRKKYPNMENQIPHYYIASFLGMTPTSLSRLRTTET